MTRFKNIFRRRDKDKETIVEFPIHLALINDQLSAKIYSHFIQSQEGSIHCCSFVSDGLWEYKQKELIFTLKIPQNQAESDLPDDPLLFFKTVYRLAKQGRIVDIGDYTEFSKPIIFGYKSLLYIPNEVFESFTVSSPALNVILLKDEELLAVKVCGFTRVLARLGHEYRYYPCPPWNDLTREPLAMKDTIKNSLLAKLLRLKVSGASVTKEKEEIILRLPQHSGELLQKQFREIPTDAVFALLTELDPRANGCLVWEPGQSEPVAIVHPNSDGSKLGGCFVVFLPQQQEEGGIIFEDGFVIQYHNSFWENFLQAIKTGSKCVLQGNGEKYNFSLEWIQETYFNPIDGRVYHSRGGWREYHSAKPLINDKQKNSIIEEVILLTSEHDLERRVDAKTMAEFINTVSKAVESHFSKIEISPEQKLMIQIEIDPKKTLRIQIASQPGIPSENIQGLYDHLQDIPFPEVEEGPVKFQIIFSNLSILDDNP